ncbi:D-alanyl-D-alanine carboxypeptidase/D-alanyl-D-alanine-endopeptidase [Dysgonomonas sp. 25]|uniref:D-alanyl-D-alanine carboxypeptidase/D-alanyl-D-alanine endopeptidase n=1 Tax=Dysgonomonas sp. 25 TaxID=2302933 RepID=UPI0013D1EFD7|nr:D-alanyl-D-alanine carboxypeptidase/D-alanyl-D-alanine-endopeptidase [Dysgonomonas sp. 25]NDV68024.1 D-alanyl-D-alanine carboxypeptidase/D-alanyl-D-alanine-endopeptidase [Dysgonomonas sp. 25]
MMTLKLKIFSVCFLISLSAAAQTKQSAVDAFVQNPALKHASIGICVKDMSGKSIVSHNAAKSLTPASTLKIVTTATALELLTPGYTYKTTLAKDKKNASHLYIFGSGDPTLGTKHLENDSEAFLGAWTNEIAKSYPEKKITKITAVDNLFGYDGISPRWIRQDMGNYYAASTYGISVFDNTYQLFFNTVRQDTCPIIVKTEPQMKNIYFLNTMKMNTSGRDNGYINGEPLSYTRVLTGNIPAGRQSFSIKGDIPDPGLYLVGRVADILNDNGFEVSDIGTTQYDYFENMYAKSKPVYDGEVFYTHHSFPLRDIIQNVNFKSNNHYAEHLLRTIGRLRNKDIYSSALDEGTKKVGEYWKAQGLDTDALFMYDGCGLAPSNAVSPAFMCDVLVHMQTKSKYKDDFLHSLPQAGKEGTVRNLLKGTRLQGKVYAKSGSIVNVRCYAGYYIDGDKKYAFAVMVNNYNGSSQTVVKAIEKLLLGIL